MNDKHDPDISREICGLIDEVVPDPVEWRDTPNSALGGKKPNQLIGTEDETMLRDLLRAAKHGMFS